MLHVKEVDIPSLNTFWQTIMFIKSFVLLNDGIYARIGVNLISVRCLVDMKMSDRRWRTRLFSWLHHFGHEWILIAFYFTQCEGPNVLYSSALSGSISPGGRWSLLLSARFPSHKKCKSSRAWWLNYCDSSKTHLAQVTWIAQDFCNFRFFFTWIQR
jgi:hypothetical protein